MPLSPVPVIEVELPLCINVSPVPKLFIFPELYSVPFEGCVGGVADKDRITRYPSAVPLKVAGKAVEVIDPEVKLLAWDDGVEQGKGEEAQMPNVPWLSFPYSQRRT